MSVWPRDDGRVRDWAIRVFYKSGRVSVGSVRFTEYECHQCMEDMEEDNLWPAGSHYMDCVQVRDPIDMSLEALSYTEMTA